MAWASTAAPDSATVHGTICAVVSGATQQRFEEGAKRRAEMLRLVQEGVPIQQAWRDVGWKAEGSYRKARATHPQWAALVTEAASRHRKVAAAPGQRYEALSHSDWSKLFCHRSHLAHQVEIADALDRTEPGELTLFNLWPGAGKSSVVVDWVTRKLAEDPDHRIMYVSESSKLVGDFVSQIQKRLTAQSFVEAPGGEMLGFDLLVGVYGPFYEPGQERRSKRPWGSSEFTVARSVRDEKDPSVAAYAISSVAYGSRADTLIVDDVQSQRSLSQTEKVLKTLRTTYFNRGTPARPLRIFVIGTRIGRGDIYEALVDEGIVDHKVELSATVFDSVRGRFVPRSPASWLLGNPKFDLSSMSADEMMEAALVVMDRQRRRVGEEAWWANYEQAPVTVALSTFGEALDGCLDSERRFGKLELVGVA